MRTGSIGNRNAEEMIRTLVEPKKRVVSSIRTKLLAMNLVEDVEFDSINIEPVMIYSLRDERWVFVKHKWEVVALVRLDSEDERKPQLLSTIQDGKGLLERNEIDGTLWAKFSLPDGEGPALRVLEQLIAAH